MDRLSLPELVEVAGATAVGNARAGVMVEHVATHSSRIRSGAAFFALRGARTDGHEYVDAAARNGAVVAVVEASQLHRAAESSGIPLVAVDDPLRALQRLAAWWRRRLDARVVAVAGSVGKTVTKDCLVHVLSAAGGDVYGTSGSYNSQLGVPLAILDCPRSATLAVIEVAVSDPGEMAHLAAVVAPDDVVLTNVGTRWRRRFADRSTQIGELLAIAHGRPVLLGQDDAEVAAVASAVAAAVRVHGRSPDLPRFERSRREPATARVKVVFPDGAAESITVHTPSDEILDDVELAVSAAWLLGAPAESIATALEDYTPTSTRMEIWRSPTGVTLVRDVATPDPIAVRSAVRTAQRLTSEGSRTVLVLAQPETAWDDAALADLAHVLAAEHVDEILGLDGAPTAATLDGLVPVRRFPSADELRSHLVDKLAVGDVCLVQSPPGRRIGDLSSSLVEAMAPTRLYVDLSAMQENVTTFRRLVGPGVQIMAMVKALAYGTDALAASLGLHESGIDWLGVSGADEGVALRRAGVNLPVVVMLGTPDEVAKMARHRLTPLVYSEPMAAAVSRLARELGRTIGVHVEVDTGMHRSGLDWRTAPERLAGIGREGHLRVEGLMTHLACADDPAKDHLTALQLERFGPVVVAARDLGLAPIVHAAATAGTIRFPDARWDLVRLGLGLWGLHPSPATAGLLTLDPVLSLVSRIVQVVEVPAGEGVGYGATYLAPAGGGRVGVVPAGYHDCVPRSFSNIGYVVVHGVRCPIVGTVSMDSMTVDLSGCPAAVVGSDVLIYGRSGAHEVRLEDVSAAIGTIPYEVMARVGPRVQRVFTRH